MQHFCHLLCPGANATYQALRKYFINRQLIQGMIDHIKSLHAAAKAKGHNVATRLLPVVTIAAEESKPSAPAKESKDKEQKLSPEVAELVEKPSLPFLLRMLTGWSVYGMRDANSGCC